MLVSLGNTDNNIPHSVHCMMQVLLFPIGSSTNTTVMLRWCFIKLTEVAVGYSSDITLKYSHTLVNGLLTSGHSHPH